MHTPRLTRWGLLAVALALVAVCTNAEEPAAQPPTTVVERDDDSELHADDQSLLSLEQRLEQLKRNEEKMREEREQMAHKLDLIRRVHRARSQLAIRKIEVSDAIGELETTRKAKEKAETRRTTTYDEKEAIAARRRNIEKLIESVKGSDMSITQRTEALAKLQKDTLEQQKAVEQKRDEARLVLQQLGQKFREKGFEKWIRYNSDSLPVLVKGSIEKATQALAPLAEKVEDLAEANDALSHEVTQRLHKILPSIRQSPFYDGILFYLVLLFPTVLATWLMLKIHARLAQLTVAHYVVALNLYFGTMSVLCLLMSLLSRNDILIVFRHRSTSAFEAFMLLHALLFVLHLFAHLVIAAVSKASKDFGQLVSIFCVGLHFFVHAYKRTILNQDPNIGAPAYFLYSIIFLYTLYDRGVTIIEAAVGDSKTPSRSFETFAPPGSASSDSLDPTSKRTVYFAGLPVFSSQRGGESAQGGKDV